MATRYSIEAVFKAVDKMSNPMRGMNKNTSKFSRALRTDFAKAQRSVDRFAKSVKQKLGRAVRNITIGLGVTAATAIGFFIKEASKIEDAVAGFTPLLGGVKKANELVEKLNQTAATTPFQFDDISKAAKQLLPVMNQDIEKTVSTFRMLGDTAGGSAQKLESITRGFTKAMLKGKVDLESLNMIAEAGVPIFDQLAKELGVTTKDMFKMVTAGEVTTDALTNTFKTMTSEGGLFFKGMEIASKTLTGKLSTLKDNISLTAASIGMNLLPIIKPLVDQAIEAAGSIREWVSANKELVGLKINDFVNNFKKAVNLTWDLLNIVQKLSPLIISLAGAFVIWKIAVYGLVAAQTIMNGLLAIQKFMQFIKIIGMISKAKGVWAAAQWALNFAMSANPIGVIMIGILALIGVIALLVKYWDEVVAVLKVVWDFMSKIFGAVGEGIGKVADFFGIDRSMSSGTESAMRSSSAANSYMDRVQSPISSAERASYSREESVVRAELLVKDPNNRTEMTSNPSNNNFQFQLSQSGGL